MWNKLERKLGKFAIPHLINYLIGGYVIGYLLAFGTRATDFNFLQYMTLEPYYIIHEFQFWRIITWVMIPPQQNILFAAIMMLFYWQLGNVLEQTWGTFKFNVYIFTGIIFTVIGAFILYAFVGPLYAIGSMFSTYYINMSIFLAFALCYPDMQVLLYFIVPVRMKWLAIIYAVLILLDFVQVGWGGKVAIIASLLNFIVFFISTKSFKDTRSQFRARSQQRTRNANNSQNQGFASSNQAKPRHKCAICGRTDITHPDLEFRYCSKCSGAYEYCQDHLFTHTHVQ